MARRRAGYYHSVMTASRTRRRERRLVVPALAVGAALAALLAVIATSASSSGPRLDLDAAAAVNSFVDRFVAADGRVVRADQGGDTVSEGEAYAMLMTAVVGDRTRFVSVWGWTRRHLLLGDGLLAWHWQHGGVVGDEPASDADLGAAAALLIASNRFRDPSLAAPARRMATAILAHETGPGAGGSTLVAGPWAKSPTEYVDPSYLAPAELDELAGALGGPWRSIASTATAELEALTVRGMLPPDWAVVGSDHVIRPAAPPGSPGVPPRFGFDAVRAPIWMAVSCDAGLRSSAGRLLPALRTGGDELGLRLDGRPDPGVATPLARLAQAGAEWAGGDQERARSDLAQVAQAEQSHPTYYGSAWVALTTLGFDGQLERCPT